MSSRNTFTHREFVEAVASSRAASETLRKLGVRAAGGNFRTVRRYAELWNVSLDHFDPAAVVREHLQSRRGRPLHEVMVEGSSYDRGRLKGRLFADGLKERRCELCGQGEDWNGRRMALILDHINGAADDHRLENLRIVCPNCAATLDTHCGRKTRIDVEPRQCALCRAPFRPRYRQQRYCSRRCGTTRPRASIPRPDARRVERPPYEQLLEEIEAMGCSAVGRKYGVSDNAVRKWVRAYEREMSFGASTDPAGGAGGRPTNVRGGVER